MDGSASVPCRPNAGTECPASAQFGYVDNSTGILNPYLALAKQYAFANYMFQTNQGPSFPSHQFLFGATAAPSAAADHAGTFVAENPAGTLLTGCTAPAGTMVQLINSAGAELPNNFMYPCFEHQTIADLLTTKGDTWTYYAPGSSSIWTAPNAIDHICQAVNGVCTGSAWQNVALNPPDVLEAIAKCNLRNVSWVTPSGAYSDHAGGNTGGGPAWVASIVNAIGNSKCVGQYGKTYWQTTAVLITWDDWGGWYDHAFACPSFSSPPIGSPALSAIIAWISAL